MSPIDFVAINETPDEYYRELAQAFISGSWDNTAAKTPENGGIIYEQDAIGANEYHVIDAWVKTTVDNVTSGEKDSHDFIKMYFRDINHVNVRGQFYKFNNNVWIVNDNSHFGGIAQDCGLRRCNNVLKIVDPNNGSIFSIPCFVDYDMSAPSSQISRYLNTPNNHAVVHTQYNEDTARLFKLNTRYILGSRPFKLYGYQDALDSAYDEPPTYLSMDMYLDEFHDGDDVENRVADNGEFDYRVSVDKSVRYFTPGAVGYVNVSVYLNDKIVYRDIIFESSDDSVASVDYRGGIIINGVDGNECEIRVSLKGNPEVFDTIYLKIAENIPEDVDIYMSPEILSIRQYDVAQLNIVVSYAGEVIIPDNIEYSTSSNIEITEKKDAMRCISVGDGFGHLYVHVTNDIPMIDEVVDFQIKTMAMF